MSGVLVAAASCSVLNERSRRGSDTMRGGASHNTTAGRSTLCGPSVGPISSGGRFFLSILSFLSLIFPFMGRALPQTGRTSRTGAHHKRKFSTREIFIALSHTSAAGAGEGTGVVLAEIHQHTHTTQATLWTVHPQPSVASCRGPLCHWWSCCALLGWRKYVRSRVSSLWISSRTQL